MSMPWGQSSRAGSMSRSTASLHKQQHEKSGTGGGGFVEKLGTLGRGKKKKQEEDEAENVALEGRDAIDTSGIPLPEEVLPEQCVLSEGEEKRLLAPESREDPDVLEVVQKLVDWINDELADQRIIVKDIVGDIYDGQIVQKLIEKLSGIRIEVPEVSQSEQGQREKLRVVLNVANQILAQPRYDNPPWNPELIHGKDFAAILHLLVAIALHFRAPIRFPDHCKVQLVVVQRKDGQNRTRYVMEEVTSEQKELGPRGERDAFDTLYDYGPEKLESVKNALITFANKHLNKINLEVTDLDTQFQDGVFLVLLMGLLEGYFVALYSFHLQVTAFQQKVQNVAFAFELMQEAEMPRPRARPEDIVNGDLKSTLRVLHNLFTKYKFVN